MNDRDAAHAKLDGLAAQIKDTEKTCENDYYAWTTACERLRRLKREHRDIWLSLFDSPMRNTNGVGKAHDA